MAKLNYKISGTTVTVKQAPPYTCILMEKLERGFLIAQKYQTLV